MPTTPRQSRRVGLAGDTPGQRVTAFEALGDRACSRCGRTIRPGALCPRQSQHGPSGASYNLGLVTVCPTCRPLQAARGVTDRGCVDRADHERLGLFGRTPPYGYVLRQRAEGPTGAA